MENKDGAFSKRPDRLVREAVGKVLSVNARFFQKIWLKKIKEFFLTLSWLKQRIDKRCYGGALSENDQPTEKQQHQNHWRQPPPLALPEEHKKFPHDTHATG